MVCVHRPLRSIDLILFFQYSDNQTFRLGVSDALGRPVFYDAPLKDIGQTTRIGEGAREAAGVAAGR